MHASHLLAIGLVCTTISGCSDGESVRQSSESTPPSATAVGSTGTVFDLTPAEHEALESRAALGDAEAAFRLSQFYSMAGGSDGRSYADLMGGDDAVQELKWLEVAAAKGHETARFNLAVVLAQSGRDCPRARAMMAAINRESPDPSARESAGYWLRDDSFQCSGVSSSATPEQ